MTYALPEDGYDSTLLTGAGSTDTTLYVTSLPSVATSGILTIYEQDARTIREKVYFTAVGGAGTSASPYYLTVTRGIRLTASAGTILFTSDTTLRQTHVATARIAMTDNINYTGLVISVINGDMETGGVMKNPASRSISNSRHLTDKEYVDAAASAVGGITAFVVSQNGADPSLTVNIGSGYFLSQGTVVTFAGASAQAVTASQTNYVMLSRAGAVTINITGFVDGFIPLAIVTCSGTDITGIADARAWLTMGEGRNSAVITDLTYGATIAVGNLLYYDTATNKLKLAISGVAAKGTGTFTGQPSNNEALVIGATTYTWKTTLTGAANEVKIGAAFTDSLTNLVAAVNASAGAGTLYGTGTVANASVTAAVNASTIVLTAILPGTAGNSVATTETTSNFSFDAAVLGTTQAGVDGGITADNAMFMALQAGVDGDTGKRVAGPGSYVTGLSALTVGEQYVSSTAGALSSSVPAAYRRRVGYAPTTTSFILSPGILPTALSGLNTAATVANFNELLTLINLTDITGTELETLSSGASSVADTLHTHLPQAQEDATFSTGSIHLPVVMNDANMVNSGANLGSNRLWKRPGTISIDTGNSASGWDAARTDGVDSIAAAVGDDGLFDSGVGTAKVTLGTVWTAVFKLRFGALPAGTDTFFFGFAEDADTLDATGISPTTSRHAGIQYNGSVWRVTNGSNTTQTTTTISTPSLGWHIFKIQRTASSIIFTMDGAVLATHTTNLPTSGALLFYFGHVNNAAANRYYEFSRIIDMYVATT